MPNGISVFDDTVEKSGEYKTSFFFFFISIFRDFRLKLQEL